MLLINLLVYKQAAFVIFLSILCLFSWGKCRKNNSGLYLSLCLLYFGKTPSFFSLHFPNILPEFLQKILDVTYFLQLQRSAQQPLYSSSHQGFYFANMRYAATLLYLIFLLSLTTSPTFAATESKQEEQPGETHLEARCGLEGKNFYWDDFANACVELREEHLKCSDDEVCRNLLGVLSICEPGAGKCSCHDTESGGKNPVGLFGRRCIVKKYLGDFCETDLECQIWNHPNVVCEHQDRLLPYEKICVCPKSRSCKLIGSSCVEDVECSSSLGQSAFCNSDTGDNVCACAHGRTCDVSLRKTHYGMSTGSLVGITLGSSVLVIIIFVLVIILLRRRNRKHRQFV